jgi:hypothetical protein
MIKGRAPGQTQQVWVGSWPEARRTHPILSLGVFRVFATIVAE